MSFRLGSHAVIADSIQPGIRTVGWDFARDLAAGESVTSVAVVILKGILSGTEFIPDANPDVTVTVKKLVQTVDGKATGSKVLVTLQSVQDGSTYKVTITSTMNANKVIQADIFVPVHDF